MYKLVQQVPAVDDFIRLRKISGLSPRPRVAVEKGLPNSLFGVHIVFGQHTIAMARVIGDGGLNFEINDVAVDPEHQGKGLGRQMMTELMDYLKANAPTGAMITLLGDVPELYLKFGFKLSSPGSEGMYLVMP